MTSQPGFIHVGALAEGFAPDSNILPATADLAGRDMRLQFSDGSSLALEFLAAGTLRTNRGEHAYRATSVRAGIYFVDYSGGESGASSTSLVLDLRRGLATSVTGTLPSERETRVDAFTRAERGDELTAVHASFRHGVIAPGVAAAPTVDATALHAPTAELIGMRNLYIYSETERYEHFYAWQCLEGAEKGLADLDRCHSFRIDEQLYLFVWREKVIPTLGVVMIDLAGMKTDGKIIGYQGDSFDAVSNFPVGAQATVLNITRYPQ
ncbi:moaF [Caballeronia udeis]|uniref:MoaF n=1 Tax=Caballeronia udeis TaxID=1232866 RepID=A0A158EUD2_9BURK|nr:MoaF C-terminal domain-containing protein [Caballeronia udeis]SAL11115.1 moaF [Caballeronia udeis]